MTTGCLQGTGTRSLTAEAPRPRPVSSHDYPPEPATAGKARRHTREFLTACPGISPDFADTAQLLVSELVANACAASPAGTTVTLTLRRIPSRLLIEVTDASPDPPVPASPGSDDIDGRGLLLVRTLAAGWGYFPLGDGLKNVWATLATRDGLPHATARRHQPERLPGARLAWRRRAPRRLPSVRVPAATGPGGTRAGERYRRRSP